MYEKYLFGNIFNYLIAAVWLINGLFCKLFNLVPRHQEIVSNILGHEHAALLTKLIGLGELTHRHLDDATHQTENLCLCADTIGSYHE
jgi:putative exporter of polyketide antibiotics